MIAWTERFPKAEVHSFVSWCDVGMFSQASHTSANVFCVNALLQRQEICSKWQKIHQIRIQLQWAGGKDLIFWVTHCADPEETITSHPANTMKPWHQKWTFVLVTKPFSLTTFPSNSALKLDYSPFHIFNSDLTLESINTTKPLVS